MNKLWKDYVAGLHIPTVFMHKDEFAKAYPAEHIKLPAVILKTNKTLIALIAANDFKHINNLSSLMNAINSKLGSNHLHNLE